MMLEVVSVMVDRDVEEVTEPEFVLAVKLEVEPGRDAESVTDWDEETELGNGLDTEAVIDEATSEAVMDPELEPKPVAKVATTEPAVDPEKVFETMMGELATVEAMEGTALGDKTVEVERATVLDEGTTEVELRATELKEGTTELDE